MNKKVKDSIKSTVDGFNSFWRLLAQMIASIMRIIVLSSVKIAVQSKKYSQLKGSNSCCVLGNGPSLKDDFENGRVRTEGNDVFCVNMFCSSPLFKKLKPRFYFLVDGSYFSPKSERNMQMIETLISEFNKIDWKMYLIISSATISGSMLLKSLNNDHVKVLRVNSTDVNGFRCFRHWVYRHRLGMPRCQTVVNFALGTAINMHYENIYLYGADHTWTRDLFVDEDNIVCYGDRHVYNKDLTVIKKKENFSTLLKCFAMMFEAHYLLEDYSKTQGVSIYNCTSDSFLDSYKRLLS